LPLPVSCENSAIPHYFARAAREKQGSRNTSRFAAFLCVLLTNCHLALLPLLQFASAGFQVVSQTGQRQVCDHHSDAAI
jgi:hypothetical protein